MADHNSLATSQGVEPEGIPQNLIEALLNSPVEPENAVALGEYSRDDPDNIARARKAAGTLLSRLGVSPEKVDDGVLCTSEVAGNVIGHSRGKITYLAVRKRAGQVAVCIGATDPLEGDIAEHPTLPEDNDNAEGGRGGFIVDFLTTAHGSRPITQAPSPETSEPPATTEHWFTLDLAA